MSQTYIGIILFTYGKESTDIIVGEGIYTVYNQLINEGCDIKIFEINPSNDSQAEIVINQVDIEAEALDKLNYYLQLDLTKSFISMKKFNEIINTWGILELN